MKETKILFESLLTKMIRLQASDLYLSNGIPPRLKIHSKIVELDTKFQNKKQLEKLAEFLGFKEKEQDLFYNLQGISRFRINAFYANSSPSFVIRRIKESVASPKKLGIPDQVSKEVLKRDGLILVSGSTGSGKSTTLASLIDLRNRTKTGHILTIEDPIEYLHQHNQSIINQREVNRDTKSLSSALRAALRQAPDVLMIGEIRTSEEMELVLQYSEIGHLVLATIHASGAVKTILRILDFFPRNQSDQICARLANNLSLILSQKLVPSIDKKEALVTEVLKNSERIKRCILKKKFSEIQDIIEDINESSMHSFDQSLYSLFKKKIISEETAKNYAENKHNMAIKLREISFGFDDEKLG